MTAIKHNTRTHTAPVRVSTRKEGDKEKQVIDGYASVFNQRSKLIFEWGETFFEVIEPGAFDDVLQREDLNVIATVNHQRDKMLGRTKSGTLQLVVDDKGLNYIIEAPNTTLGRDTLEQINRGDYYESSFIFTVLPEHIRWDKTDEGMPIRYISKIHELIDVSVVTNGAYANTDVASREYKEIQETQQHTPTKNLRLYKAKTQLIKFSNTKHF